MLRWRSHRAWVGLAACVAVLAGASAGATSVDVTAGRLSFNQRAGGVLRAGAGGVFAHVTCSARPRGRCTGGLSVNARGSKAARLAGSLIGASSIKVGAGPRRVKVPISREARRALGNNELAVTIRLTQPGRPARVKRATVIHVSNAKVVHGHAKPTSRPPGQGSEQAYHWSWDIPAHNLLILPAFTCPASTPYVKSNGKATTHGTHGMQADLEVSAKDGTGYAAFDRGKSESYKSTDASDKKVFMLGWVAGTLFFNSIWAPVTSAGHFELTASCTDDEADAAYMQVRDTDDWFYLVFPWDN